MLSLNHAKLGHMLTASQFNFPRVLLKAQVCGLSSTPAESGRLSPCAHYLSAETYSCFILILITEEHLERASGFVSVCAGEV